MEQGFTKKGEQKHFHPHPRVVLYLFCNLMHSATALADYEDRVNTYGQQLENHIAATAGQPVDVSKWFCFLTFDVMGDFAFVRSFKMLEDEKWHYAVLMLRRALTLLGPLSPVPWSIQLAFSIPLIPIVHDWKTMIQWCSDRMTDRNGVSKHWFGLFLPFLADTMVLDAC